jgi:hypothetical protein
LKKYRRVRHGLGSRIAGVCKQRVKVTRQGHQILFLEFRAKLPSLQVNNQLALSQDALVKPHKAAPLFPRPQDLSGVAIA